MTTTNKELIAQARRIEAMGESLGDELSGIWLFARNARIALEAAQAVSLPDRETLVNAADAALEVATARLDDTGEGFTPAEIAVDAVLAALSTQPAAGEVTETVWHKDQFYVTIETDAEGLVTISDELLVKLMTESGWVVQP